MSKVIVVPKGEGQMKLGDYNYVAAEETLFVGGGDLVEKISQLNPNEGGGSSE